MTPEGKVKKAVKEILNAYHPLVSHRWPVQNGMGKPMLDCVGCCCGLHFEIETKATPKDELTPRQEITKEETEASLGKVFVIKATHDTDALEEWLHQTVMRYKRKAKIYAELGGDDVR